MDAPRDPAREVHVSVAAQEIASFVESERSETICFRCGERGHVRSVCMTFRTSLCDAFENGGCTNDACPKAHGIVQLRTPWKMRCVRVVKQDGQFICIGCNSMTHTFRKCPHNQDLIYS